MVQKNQEIGSSAVTDIRTGSISEKKNKKKTKNGKCFTPEKRSRRKRRQSKMRQPDKAIIVWEM